MHRWLFVLICAFFCFTSTAHAQTDGDSAYTTLVTIDEVANDAIQAKERGLHQAEIKGLWTILSNASPDRAKEIFDSLKPNDIHGMVESLRIENEREKATRYQADAYITYKRLRVDALLLHHKGVAPPSSVDLTGEHTVLVLPLLNDGSGNLVLWQKNNTWKDALNRHILELGKNKVILPYGDPTDTLWMDQETVLAGDIAVLQKVAERYGTRNVVIAVATLERTGQDASSTAYSANIALRRAGADTTSVLDKKYSAPAGRPVSDVMDKAAIDILSTLADSASQYAIFAEPEDSKTKALVIRAEYTSPDKWISTRSFIERIEGVKLVDIGAVTTRYCQATIYYRGSANTIKSSLEAQGNQVKDTGTYFIITIP
jgi:hypothetical protein